MSDTPPRGVVGLLTAQALAFGVTLALLIIPANALFLDAYGSEWLPATYIAIAVFGTRRVRAHRPRGAPYETRSCRDREPRHPRLALRRVLADPRGGRRLGVGGPPRAVPDRAPAGLRLHRRTGRQAARRPADEGAVPSRRLGLRRRVPPRRPPRHPAPRPARFDRAPAARDDRRATRVPRRSSLATERRFPEVRSGPSRTLPAVARPPLRTLFASGLVLLLLVYQVLSAMGS